MKSNHLNLIRCPWYKGKTNQRKMDALKDARDKFLAGDKDFSSEEVSKMVRASERLAARAVLTLAAETLASLPNARKFTKQRNRLISMTPASSDPIRMDFAETPNYLCLCVSVGPADYSTIPKMIDEKYVSELQEQYEFAARTTTTFWKHFRALNPELVLPSIMDDIKVDPSNPISLYFDSALPKRVVLCGMYRDPQGAILVPT